MTKKRVRPRTSAKQAAIRSLLTHGGDFAHGGDPDRIAAEWVIYGFSADEVDAWLQARTFHAVCAHQLALAGVTPVQAKKRTAKGLGEYTDTVGYKLSNGDLAFNDALAVAKGRTHP